MTNCKKVVPHIITRCINSKFFFRFEYRRHWLWVKADFFPLTEKPKKIKARQCSKNKLEVMIYLGCVGGSLGVARQDAIDATFKLTWFR